ncbi:MAG: FAD:protein FMN transferase [Oscillospiraceae bacterium]|nr:FAD:protein FMN transferase [Oscillospiraceae bacterium]MBQ3999635.1 FAD:protein FMN transferase [Oscillospiraceae bacterium]MBQ5411759.1 FAD:protein FMN transferase [Oscillospiraceae bacterium]
MSNTVRNRYRIAVILTAIVLAFAAGMTVYVMRLRSYAAVTFHMDTYVSYDIRCSRPERAVRMMEAAVKRCEELFNRFDPSSEIARINENAGAPVEVSEDTYAFIYRALRLAEETGGSFDPTVGALSDLWGFGSVPHVPDPGELTECLKSVGYGKTVLYCEDNKYYVRAGEGQKLDLGAIAKGYALNELSMAAYRANCTEGIISLGGNVLLLGSGQDGSGYKVGIRCPDENSNSSVVTVVLENTVLSTSGSYERFFFEEGVRYCHIIDPRTGDCSEKDLKSVTVICEDPVVADCMSTAYYVMGIDRTLDALASGEISGMAIDTSGVIYVSEDLTDRIVPGSVAEGYELEVVG